MSELAQPVSLVLWIPGQPRSQGSKKVIPGLQFPVEAGKHTASWRRQVTREARAQAAGRPPLDGPLHLRLICYFVRPKSHWLRNDPSSGKLSAAGRAQPAPTSHQLGDASKMVRAVEDALVVAKAITDDSRITTLEGRKRWSDRFGASLDRRARSRGARAVRGRAATAGRRARPVAARDHPAQRGHAAARAAAGVVR